MRKIIYHFLSYLLTAQIEFNGGYRGKEGNLILIPIPCSDHLTPTGGSSVGVSTIGGEALYAPTPTPAAGAAAATVVAAAAETKQVRLQSEMSL